MPILKMLTQSRVLQQRSSSELEAIVQIKQTGLLKPCFDNHTAHISF